jgi:putative hemolysin
MMVTCADCVHAMNITEEVRQRLGQENKEIVNTLERQGLSLDEFCYCEKLGYIESVVMRRECQEYSPGY